MSLIKITYYMWPNFSFSLSSLYSKHCSIYSECIKRFSYIYSWSHCRKSRQYFFIKSLTTIATCICIEMLKDQGVIQTMPLISFIINSAAGEATRGIIICHRTVPSTGRLFLCLSFPPCSLSPRPNYAACYTITNRSTSPNLQARNTATD